MARTNISIGPCRLSYLSVFTPKEHKGKTDASGRHPIVYSLVGLIPKQATKQCPDPDGAKKKIEVAIEEVMTEEFGKVPPKFKTPLRDGDSETDNEGVSLYPGYWFFNAEAKENFPPVLFEGPEPRHVMDTKNSKWKSGDWGQVKLSIWTWDNKTGGKGCSCGLKGVRFTHVDLSLGSNEEASASDFEPVADAELPDYPDPFEND